MARFTDVFTESNAPKENRPVSKKIKNIHYTKLVQSEYQYRDRTSKVVDSLADLINKEPNVFSEQEIQHILASVVLGLDYLHSNKKIHRVISLFVTCQ